MRCKTGGFGYTIFFRLRVVDVLVAVDIVAVDVVLVDIVLVDIVLVDALVASGGSLARGGDSTIGSSCNSSGESGGLCLNSPVSDSLL